MKIVSGDCGGTDDKKGEIRSYVAKIKDLK